MKRIVCFLLLCLDVAFAAEVTILHTNDLHARISPLNNHRGGFAELATVIRRERANCAACVLLNAGDLVQGTPVSTIFHGTPVYEIGNLLGFDAATIGNHEFDYGWQKVLEFLGIAKYPVVSANLVDDTGRLMTAKPYVILNAGAVRVGVIGATIDLSNLTTPKTLGPWRTLPVVETARKYAAELRDRADIIVLLGHISEQDELDVLHHAPEIAVTVSGHAHRGLDHAESDSGRVLVRVKGYGEELGRLDLQIDGNKVTSWKWKRIPVENVPPATDVAELVAHWEKEVAKAVDQPIGESPRQYSRAETRALMERVMREELNTDFAFMNAGGVRDTFPQGRILARHVWQIMPFDNKVVIGKFKGRQLPVTVTRGRTVEPDREYTLAVTDFTAANQSAKGELETSGLVFGEDGPLLRDMLIEWVKKQKVLP